MKKIILLIAITILLTGCKDKSPKIEIEMPDHLPDMELMQPTHNPDEIQPL